MKLLLWVYGFVLAAGFAGVAYRPNYFGNVGFLVLGVFAGIYPAFIVEEIRRGREAANLAKALFVELANRVGRCCFDFEDPWEELLRNPKMGNTFWLRKFVPEAPVIFPTVGAKIALVDNDAVQALIEFYVALAAWKRDIENTTEEALAQPIPTPVHDGQVQFLARRLQKTLGPGKRALEALSKHVPEYEDIERNATRDGDRDFAEAHPNAGKLHRERIELILKAIER